jgi:hypothetical protein
MNLRAHLETLRRTVDATSFFFEPTRNSPKPILERIRCHPSDTAAVYALVHEVNPWDGPIEAAGDLARGEVEVSWLTAGRSPRTARFSLH